MSKHYAPTTADELLRVYREANEAAMHEANLRDGFGSNMSSESIVAGLRAVAAQAVRDAADKVHVQRFAASLGAIHPSVERTQVDTFHSGVVRARLVLIAEADRIAGGTSHEQ